MASQGVPPAHRVTLGAACVIAILLRLPLFRYPLVSDDEAIYDAMARVVAHGGTMYADTVDHKPPGLVYTYSAIRWLIDHVGGPSSLVMNAVHAVGILVVVLTCLALHAIARELLPKGRAELATVPPLLYALASAASVPPDALAVNGELLMNLPTALAVLAALGATRGDTKALARFGLGVLAGAFVAIAALYKYQAALAGVALVCLLPEGTKSARGAILPSLLWSATLGLGFALPFATTALYFADHGALAEAVRWGLAFNAHYLKEGPDLALAMSRLGMQLLGVVLPSVLLYGGGVWGTFLLWRRTDAGIVRGRLFLSVWVVTSLYSVTLGRRFFGHYFLQPELPLALLAAGPVGLLAERRPRLTVALLAVPALLFFAIAAIPERFAKLVYGGDPDYVAIGRAVNERTKPTDTIWVWGNVPQIYATADRTPGVRFTFCNYLTGLSPGSRSELDPTYDSRENAVPGAWDMVVHDLDRTTPAIIIDTAAGGMKSYGKYPVASFPVLDAYLRQHYRPDGVVDGAVLFRRRDGV